MCFCVSRHPLGHIRKVSIIFLSSPQPFAATREGEEEEEEEDRETERERERVRDRERDKLTFYTVLIIHGF